MSWRLGGPEGGTIAILSGVTQAPGTSGSRKHEDGGLGPGVTKGVGQRTHTGLGARSEPPPGRWSFTWAVGRGREQGGVHWAPTVYHALPILTALKTSPLGQPVPSCWGRHPLLCPLSVLSCPLWVGCQTPLAVAGMSLLRNRHCRASAACMEGAPTLGGNSACRALPVWFPNMTCGFVWTPMN